LLDRLAISPVNVEPFAEELLVIGPEHSLKHAIHQERNMRDREVLSQISALNTFQDKVREKGHTEFPQFRYAFRAKRGFSRLQKMEIDAS